MVYRHFNLYLNIRIAIVVLLALCIGFLAARHNSVFLIIFLSCLEVVSLASLIRFLNHSNRQISFFIKAIKNDDTTIRFPIQTDSAVINDLHKSLNELNVIIQKTKSKSQIKEHYFGELLQNIGTGIIVYDEKEFVTEVNPATLELLGLQTLTHLSQIDRIDSAFHEDLIHLNDLQKKVITLRRQDVQVQVVSRCSIIKLKDENVKLITLQDIRGELERKELDSWIKLIRVLSHEIMNSLAPITSIAQSLCDIWKTKMNGMPELSNDDDVCSTINGLDVISDRGNGLIQFVQSYRMLTKVPVPQIAPVDMKNFFDRLSILVSPMKAQYHVAIIFIPPVSSYQIEIDEQMMVQVIVNLVKNAAEAMQETENPMIEVTAKQYQNGQNEILVKNNGPVIPSEIMDEIFIPFFTTKSVGSGIGLSYSRQIMRAHGGTISCYSDSTETVFRIQW